MLLATATARSRAARWAIRTTQALSVLLLLPLLLHAGIVASTVMTAPDVTVGHGQPVHAQDDDSRRDLGRSYLRHRGPITEIRLVGAPAAVGDAHVRLAYDQVVDIERTMHDEFARHVPWAPLRWAIVDIARWRFRHLDLRLGGERREEIAAYAKGFHPDPFADGMDTYQRFVFLNSLYDLMLSFEHSPLVGCSSVVLTGEASADGHTLLGRNFDFEGPPILDDRKAVFLVHEVGRIPYASVSWPGFVGVATGVNATGVGVVVHGARAGQPQASGKPVALVVRDVLGLASNTRQAIEVAGRFEPMVSHLLLVADASGDVVVVERAPGAPLHVRLPEGNKLPLTNHFEGPLRSDPANVRVKQRSSTLPRRRRLDGLLENLPPGASVERVVEILRDKRGVQGAPLPLGHRSSIDALIATHSVVMDLSARVLWVNEGPHAAGRYVRFDLARLLDPSYTPGTREPLQTIPADPILRDGRYETWSAAGSPHRGVE